MGRLSFKGKIKMFSLIIFVVVLPDGWFIFGSNKLKIFRDRKTWGRARKYCQWIGGDLVSINSGDKHEFVTQLLDRFITNATKG